MIKEKEIAIVSAASKALSMLDKDPKISVEEIIKRVIKIIKYLTFINNRLLE